MHVAPNVYDWSFADETMAEMRRLEITPILDLLYAHVPDADIGMYLMDNGLTRAEYDGFMRGEPPGYQVLGNDYYGRNERIIKPDGTTVMADDVFGWYQITREYYWDTALVERNGRVGACGLYDLERRERRERRERPVAAAYRALLQEFGRITIVPHGEMFVTTDAPAMLKVEV